MLQVSIINTLLHIACINTIAQHLRLNVFTGCHKICHNVSHFIKGSTEVSGGLTGNIKLVPLLYRINLILRKH